MQKQMKQCTFYNITYNGDITIIKLYFQYTQAWLLDQKSTFKMAHKGEMTEKQKQRIEQAKQDLEMEHQIIEWIDKVLHKRPAIEDEEHYIQFIK